MSKSYGQFYISVTSEELFLTKIDRPLDSSIQYQTCNSWVENDLSKDVIISSQTGISGTVWVKFDKYIQAR